MRLVTLVQNLNGIVRNVYAKKNVHKLTCFAKSSENVFGNWYDKVPFAWR